MRHKLLQIVLGFLLSFTLSFNLGIKQLVHSHSGHTDTVHQCGSDQKNAYAKFYIDQEHHHCDYLTDVLPHFTNTTFSFELNPVYIPVYPIYSLHHHHLVPRDAVIHFLLRGPPASV